MLRFNDIADQMLEYNPGTDLELLQRAYVFSAKVHEGQERLSGEPYLIHPLEVAGILVQMRVDDVTVAAGLLHDTLEDTLTTREELVRLFGEKTAFLVEGLTKLAAIEFTSARARQAENFRKMLVAMSEDIRILLIKLADRLHNMRTLGYMKEASARRIAQETVDIYAPLAARLGIHWMKQELESLSFRTLHPEVVTELEEQIAGNRDERGKYIEDAIAEISSILADTGLRVEVTGRLKDLPSIHAKMQSQGISLDEIYDMIAFRIVIRGGTPGDCYAVLGLVHQTWSPVPARFKDYVALAKPNGYQSLHTTVIGRYGERMEVQIRTEEMHRNAELGIAAHWKYKQGRFESDEQDVDKFAWLRKLLEVQQDLADPHEFLDTVKMDLFPEEVFVFTPIGDVFNLPQRATALDFAYAIHSEVGDQCAGAKVNGKQVPLRHILHNGDTVEIQANPRQFPRKDWLEFVSSSKARTRIRHALRVQGRERSIQLGRDILERECRKQKLSFAELMRSGELERLARDEGQSGSVDELFSAVGYGKLAATRLVSKLRGEEPEAPKPASRGLRGLFRREKRSDSDIGVRVSGLPDVLVRFGGCCDPLPGDDVIGFVTVGRGVTVHVRDCPRVYELEPERLIDVAWDAAEAKQARVTKVRVTSADQPGILAKITKTISSAGINIGAATITTGDGALAVQSFDLWVSDVDSLNKVMKEIQKVKGVRKVERVRG